MVEINLHNEIILSSPFPEATPTDPRISCSLYLKLNNRYVAHKWFSDNGILHIESLSPNLLYSLYHQERAQVICHLAGSATDALIFKKQAGHVFVVDDGLKQRKTVHEDLATSKHFTEYALKYYGSRPINEQSQQDSFGLFTILKKEIQLEFRSGVSVILMGNGSLCLTCPFPGLKLNTELIQCSLDLYFETEQDLYETFACHTQADLGRVTPEHLMELFAAGQADVFCLMELGKIGGNLSYRRSGDKMLAIDYHHGNAYAVKTPLITGNDFIVHTLNYCLSRQTKAGIE